MRKSIAAEAWEEFAKVMIQHHPDHPGLCTYWSRPWAKIDPEYEQKPWERTVQERPATPDALFLIHARQIEGASGPTYGRT